MSDSCILIFTRNLKPGELARFEVTLSAPWGEHKLTGSIIHSQVDNAPRVLWPRMGKHLAHCPAWEDRIRAEEIVLARWREFLARMAA